MTAPTKEVPIPLEELKLDYGAIIEESLNEIFVFDAATLRFVKANKGARQNTGYSMEELRCMTPVDIKPEHSEESFRQVISPLLQGEELKIRFETIHRRKDGSTYLVEVHLQSMNFDNRQLLVAIILDITERIQIKSELVQARAILDSTPDAMVVVDDKGFVQLANKQMSELLGYSTVELMSMNVDELVPVQYRADHAEHRNHFAAKPRVRSMGSNLDLLAVTKAGKEIPIEVSLSPIQTSAGTLVAAAIRDIAERKAVENALHESQKNLIKAKEIAENATETKTRFLAAASHDLRQPLQALRLYLSALSNKLGEPKTLQLSQKMHLSLDTMGGMLETLLDISALETGSVKPQRRTVLLSEVFDRIVTDSAQQAAKKGLKFECLSDDVAVSTDPALLERIIENFVTNAIKYTERGHVSIDSEVLGNDVKIVVSDSGAGIPEEALESVFDEYYQLDNSVRDRRKGVGLGLSIVKHIANLLGHPINASSIVGEGSRFSVTVPLAHQLKVEAPGTGDDVIGLGMQVAAPLVLIVDDDEVITDAMAEMLDTFDIEIVTAQDGLTATGLIDQGLSPSILVTDYRMPEMTGIEVVRTVRELMQADIPAVIMTGDTSSSEISEAKLSNCKVLHKPIDMQQLLSLIESIKT